MNSLPDSEVGKLRASLLLRPRKHRADLKEDSQEPDGLSPLEEMKENSQEQTDANSQSDGAKTKNIY